MSVNICFDELPGMFAHQFEGVGECVGAPKKHWEVEKQRPMSRKQRRELALVRKAEREEIKKASNLWIGDIECRVDGTLDVGGVFDIRVATDDCCQRCGIEVKVYQKVSHYTKLCRKCANFVIASEKEE